MIDSLEILKKPIPLNSLDFRIQSINKGKYATILVYKDARVDMDRLDEAFTPLGWKREHSRDNHNCIVSVWCQEKKQWVSKEDTGTESNTEQAKGLASDSFKRACFNLGIGRELYSYPTISIKLKDNEVQEFNGKFKQSFGLKLSLWTWGIQWDNGKISYMLAKDNNDEKRFSFGSYNKDLAIDKKN